MLPSDPDSSDQEQNALSQTEIAHRPVTYLQSYVSDSSQREHHPDAYLEFADIGWCHFGLLPGGDCIFGKPKI
jgi:hypothetical protein